MPFSTYGSQDHGPGRAYRHHQEIELMAYHLWVEAGRPDGMKSAAESWQDFFWLEAEKKSDANQNFVSAVTGGKPFPKGA